MRFLDFARNDNLKDEITNKNTCHSELGSQRRTSEESHFVIRTRFLDFARNDNRDMDEIPLYARNDNRKTE